MAIERCGKAMVGSCLKEGDQMSVCSVTISRKAAFKFNTYSKQICCEWQIHI